MRIYDVDVLIEPFTEKNDDLYNISHLSVVFGRTVYGKVNPCRGDIRIIDM